MAEGHKDYSGTPLWRKLGIRQGSRVALIGGPPGFTDLLVRLAPLPPEVTFLTRASTGCDVVVLFTTRRRVLERRFARLAAALEPSGRLWVAWPTSASGVDTDLTFGVVQELGLAAGLVDNKTASISEVFQGCQFVYRLVDRPAKGRPANAGHAERRR
ncbi:MAG: DUF3052 domain-containing protein [Actinomycetota bacterium]